MTIISRSRGYLPHLEVPESKYFLTFRLTGTLPKNVLKAFQEERTQLRQLAEKRNSKLNEADEKRLAYLETKKIQEYLDKGIGECWLKEERIARIVADAIHHFENIRYVSHAWCIMPKHVHWLITPRSAEKLGRLDSEIIKIVHSLKSFTAHQANKELGKTGPFWSREYYDHLVRSSEQFSLLINYVLKNPVKAGLCKNWECWPWTECSDVIRTALTLMEN